MIPALARWNRDHATTKNTTKEAAVAAEGLLSMIGSTRSRAGSALGCAASSRRCRRRNFPRRCRVRATAGADGGGRGDAVGCRHAPRASRADADRARSARRGSPCRKRFEVYGGKFGCLGTLPRWKRTPELARGNTQFMLAVALAFTGPVVEALGLEPPMIQLFRGKRRSAPRLAPSGAEATMGFSCNRGIGQQCGAPRRSFSFHLPRDGRDANGRPDPIG